MRLKYPFGNLPDIEAKISWRYNEHWQREVIIIWEQKDGLGFSQEELEKAHLWNLCKAKEIVEGMHGKFEYEAKPGKGHVLTLCYPKINFYAEGDKPESLSWQMRILVIDPDRKFIDQIFNKYTPLKYIVEEATNSEAGLEIFQKEKVHLTIVDEHMPGSLINGTEVIRRIKEMDSAACCVMTTFSEEDKASQAQARELGVIAYYVKPFNFQRLNYSITETRGVFKLRDIVNQWSIM
jgi:CheY-like chemotaxis protein